jgi:hypothetical protein
MSRFLLVTHGSRGDVDPFLELARELVDRGRDVLVLTHAPFGPAVTAVGAEFHAVDDTDSYDRYLRRTSALIERRPHGSMPDYYTNAELFFDRLGLTGGLSQLRREIDVLSGVCGPVVIVGRHTSALSAKIAAELSGNPLCLVALSPTQLQTSPVAGMHLGRTVAGPINQIRADLGLTPLSTWSRWIGEADKVVGLWPAWFDQAGYPSAPEVLLAGFALAHGAAPAPTAFPRDAVLISGGTGRMVHPDFYHVAINGVRAAGRRAVVVTRHRDLLPICLPDLVQYEYEMDFRAVMPRAAAVLHHGGIGTVACALRAETPQVILPYGGDRPDNAARLRAANLAGMVDIADWTTGAVAAAVAACTSAERRADLAGTAALMTARSSSVLATATEAMAAHDLAATS